MLQIHPSVWFPPVETAGAEGLLAVGGDLSRRRLLAAYRGGIFPCYAPGEPILWWSPEPRCVLYPARFRLSRSARKSARRGGFHFQMDTAFARVVGECAAPRGGAAAGMRGWITPEMARAYTGLHHAGFAHSAEIWQRGRLVGGLYGVALGGVFFGESMFSRVNDASKIALARLIERLLQWDFRLIDCQMHSPHLTRLGAVEIPRAEFLRRLRAALRLRGRAGSWAGADDGDEADGDGDSGHGGDSDSSSATTAAA
ncbi:MAG: leucyl/phenylalanyl-tRNA--protein transferase [Gammaproteobacteria bacterium]